MHLCLLRPECLAPAATAVLRHCIAFFFCLGHATAWCAWVMAAEIKRAVHVMLDACIGDQPSL